MINKDGDRGSRETLFFPSATDKPGKQTGGVCIMHKTERVRAVLRGEIPDRVPAGFWFHYPAEFTAKQTADAHLQLFHHTGMLSLIHI